LINLQFRVLDIDPDLIIVYHGTNDVHTRLVSPDAYKGDNSGRRQQWSPPDVPLAERSLLFRLLLRRWGVTGQAGLGSLVNSPDFLGAGSRKWPLESKKAKAVLQDNQPIFFRRNLSNIAIIAKSHGVNVIFATWAHSEHFDDYASHETYKQGFRENNQVVREVADKHSAHLFDFAAVMPGKKDYWSDGRHVNEDGALLKAQLFADFIDRSAIAQRPVSIEDSAL
jgi:lysophospholipase L1-like esterase